MNRKEFLSIIPALSSLPFLSKEIIREKDAIIIPEAKEIKIVQEMPANIEMDRDRLKFLMVYDGMVVGTAGMTTIGMGDGWMEGYDLEIPAYVRPPRLNVQLSFDCDQVTGNIWQMLHAHRK